MSGLAGLFRPGGLEDRDAVDRVRTMTASQAHRGPDDDRIEVFGSPPFCAMGVRRLAITDPEGGAQPTCDASKRWWVTLNGEIYNHRRLRQEAEAWGARFQTRSDTEVIAALVAQIGVARAVTRLDGMFALAILDSTERRLWLVRDRMGVKPLYWCRLPDGTVAWASELKGLLVDPMVPRRPDPRAARAVALWEYVPTPWTPWQDIGKVEPGTWIDADEAGQSSQRWWNLPVPVDGSEGDLDRWARSVAGALGVATNRRLECDVPVGFLLSGGLDSSAVTAIAQARSDEPVRTYSVALDVPGFDEGPHARGVAAALGTHHREIRLTADELPGLLDRLTAGVCEPLADASLVAALRLMDVVSSDGLKCVLSGDGADEIFAGYPTYLAHRLAAVGKRAGLARAGGSLLRRATRRLPVGAGPLGKGSVTPDYMARRFAQGVGRPWHHRNQVWLGAWLPEELGVDDDDPVWATVDRHAAAAEGADPVSRAMYLDQRLYLGDGILVKVDRASMAHGVEVRSPFLDHRMVELAASIPVGLKLHGRETKRVLRRAVADIVPPETLNRPKHGFSVPIGPWLRGPCKGLLDGLPEAVEGLLPPDEVRRAVREHLAGQADHRRRLWSALVLARWRSGPWGWG